MKPYTRTGDLGTTSTFTGKRVRKNDDIIEAVGEVDVVISHLQSNRLMYDEGTPEHKQLSKMVEGLYQLCAELSNGKASGLPKTIQSGYVDRLEKSIDEIGIELDHFVDFTKPMSVGLNISRTSVRTLERRLTSLMLNEQIRPVIYQYINRMSDYLFVLAVKEEDNNGSYK